jgi:hypothetical protein
MFRQSLHISQSKATLIGSSKNNAHDNRLLPLTRMSPGVGRSWGTSQTGTPDAAALRNMLPFYLPGFNNTIETIKVTRFDFMTQVQSLLDDSVLNRDENLVINSIDRFQKYFPPDGRLGECYSGSWYKHAWDKMEKDGICDFMIPIIL